MTLLIKKFIAEEVTPDVRKLILDAVNQNQYGTNEAKIHFEFNRFEITIDYANNVVVIEDVLDVSPAGEEIISLGEFMRAIGD